MGARRTALRGGFEPMANLQSAPRRGGWSWWYLLFVVEFLLIIWPGFFNSIDPTLWGIPFFYWYQLLVVVIGAALTAVVYFATREV